MLPKRNRLKPFGASSEESSIPKEKILNRIHSLTPQQAEGIALAAEFKIKKSPAMKIRRGDLLWRGAAVFTCLAVLALVACAPAPHKVVVQPAPEPVQPPPAQVYIYPKSGQTPEQLDRDRYECYGWAVRQTRFDPNISLPPERRVAVVPATPPGRDTAIGAVAGAAIGALAAGPRHAVGGLLIGGALGGVAGAVSDSNRQESARAIEQSYAMQNQAQRAALDQRAFDFRRAMSACLEGRGYTVQ